MGNKGRKIDQLLERAMSDDLTDYLKLYKAMKKRLPFGGGKKIAAVLLKEVLGSISEDDIKRVTSLDASTETGKIVFEDIKNGRVRIFVNVGKNHRLSPGDLIREIVRRTPIDGKQIGKIDIHSTYSFFEVPEQYGEMVIISFENTRLKGVPVVMEPAKKRKQN